MQQEQVQVVGTEASQGGFNAAENIVPGKIVALGETLRRLIGQTDSALAGDQQFFPQARRLAEHFGKQRLRVAAAVNIGEVEMSVSRLHRCADSRFADIPVRRSVIATDTHAAINEARGYKLAVSKYDRFHIAAPPVPRDSI